MRAYTGYKVVFTIAGPSGTNYLVKSPGKTSRATGDNWFVKLPHSGLYTPGQYIITWNDDIIPYDATVPDAAKLKIKLKLLLIWAGEV